MIAALLLAALAPPTLAGPQAGMYQAHQIEIGAALELRKDGHFRYQLDYGAVSESAEGEWRFDGTAVRLTSAPKPKQPEFALVRDDPAPLGELFVNLEGQDWGRPLDVIVFFDGRRAERLTADDTGRVDLTGKPYAAKVQPLMPVYDAAFDPVSLSDATGHRLVFRFERNDMGKAAFRGEPLQWDGSQLLLQRYDTDIRFQRVEP